jgi:hypothetical protein
MDLGSGIRKKPIPDPGSRGQKGTGSRIRIRNTATTGPPRTIGKSFTKLNMAEFVLRDKSGKRHDNRAEDRGPYGYILSKNTHVV